MAERCAYYREFQTIIDFYGQRRATRSGELLIEHIRSGLALLDGMGATDKAKAAFCLHPIVQMPSNVNVEWSPAYTLAKEYAEKANAYLCTPRNDWVKTCEDVFQLVGTMSADCADMLAADKMQNRISFNLHHKGKHARSAQLAAYFNLWLEYLESRLWVQHLPNNATE